MSTEPPLSTQAIPPQPVATVGRTQAANLCALALGICFFVPWMHFFGARLSGFDFQKLSDVGKLFWLLPVFAALTLCAGLVGKSQKIAGQLAGAAPFVILAYGLSQLGKELFNALAPGAWIGLVLGAVLFLLVRR